MPAVGIPLITALPPKTARKGLVGAVVTALASVLLALTPATDAEAAPVLLSQGKQATASSQEHYGTPAGSAVDVEWYGERGRTIFYQNEKAYDAPAQAAIQNGTTKGYAAYRVDDSVDVHEGWGMGSYSNYDVDPTIRQDHGFKAPVKPGVRFHSLLVVSLGGNGHYDHVINDTGSPTSGTSTAPSTVVSYP